MSEAGVAVGLVTVAADSYRAVAGEMRTMLLAIVAINETVGPIRFRRALDRNPGSTEPVLLPPPDSPARASPDALATS